MNGQAAVKFAHLVCKWTPIPIDKDKRESMGWVGWEQIISCPQPITYLMKRHPPLMMTANHRHKITLLYLQLLVLTKQRKKSYSLVLLKEIEYISSGISSVA